jgi:hypothetical protein
MQPDERTVRRTGNVIFQFRYFALHCLCMDRNDRATIAFKRQWNIERVLLMRSSLHFEADVFVSAMHSTDRPKERLCERYASSGQA